ncbi:hypothetical protein FQA39_LY07581 [Lamprigera yunnana]|nr:hypothetical protein FQA39_LY07581 [Lamprigera yunnana]
MSKRDREEVESVIFGKRKKVIRSPEEKKEKKGRRQKDSRQRKSRSGGNKRPNQRDHKNDGCMFKNKTVNPLDPNFDKTVLKWYEEAESDDNGGSYFEDKVLSQYNDES